MIADRGFGFHTKVKVSFLKPEKVNIHVDILVEKMQARSPTEFSFAFLFVFILKSLSLLFTSR